MKPFDISKFRKDINKSVPGIAQGFFDPIYFLSTGNYALNYLLRGNFNKAIPLGKVTVLAGESGSGKSYLAAGTILKDAQDNDIFPVLIDTEHALDESWLTNLGIDTSPDKLLKVGANTLNKCSQFCFSLIEQYKKEHDGKNLEDQPAMLIVIDSISMLSTEMETDQLKSGDIKGTMGRKAQSLKQFISGLVGYIANTNIGIVLTSHSYNSMTPYGGDKLSGGSGPEFAASQIIIMNKYQSRLDEEGRKGTKTTGIRSKVNIIKSRYSKPFEKVDIVIPWATGLDPYSGLFDLFKERGVIEKPSGNKYIYIDKSGTEHKVYEREININHEGICDLIMSEWDEDKYGLKALHPDDNNHIDDEEYV